ncbi:hypothetical protein BJX99DRAFT_229852 [Aspergillus californicus]
MRSLCLLIVVAAAVFPAVTAQICNPPWGEYGYSYMAHSQSELDGIAERCTTVNGSVVMGFNYTGSFYLPNVRNITRLFRWAMDADLTQMPTPTSVDLPDLEYLGSSMWLNSLPTLRNVSMPRLKTAGWDVNMDYVYEADFRSLETAEYLTITGNMSSLRLDSLREVHQRLVICNWDMCDYNISPPSSVDISLPLLQSVGVMDLEGMISSLEVPSFTTLTGYGRTWNSLKFSTIGGPAINLTFPRLSNSLGEIDLTGNIGGLAIPNLRNMSLSGLSLNSSIPLAVDLPFEEASTIILRGNISSVIFPNLHSLNSSFIVDSDNPSLDCDTLLDTIANATNIMIGVGGRLHCYPAADSAELSNSGLSTGVRAAIGVVIGVVGLAIILGALYFLRRTRARQRLTTESSVQLQESTPPTYEAAREDRDPLPEYAPRLSK